MTEKDGEKWEAVLGERDCVSISAGRLSRRDQRRRGRGDHVVMIGSPKPMTPTYAPDHPLSKVKRG